MTLNNRQKFVHFKSMRLWIFFTWHVNATDLIMSQWWNLTTFDIMYNTFKQQQAVA